jgi:hypothetical protein
MIESDHVISLIRQSLIDADRRRQLHALTRDDLFAMEADELHRTRVDFQRMEALAND